MADLNVEAELRRDRWRVRVNGELDVASAEVLSVRLNDVVDAGKGDVTIDLRALTFLDSRGLHALLNAHRRLTRQGRALEVLCSRGDVARVMELTRLTDTLGVKVSR